MGGSVRGRVYAPLPFGLSMILFYKITIKFIYEYVNIKKNMSESLELLRNDVKIALSRGALDGEAGIVPMSYFQAYGPAT